MIALPLGNGGNGNFVTKLPNPDAISQTKHDTIQWEKVGQEIGEVWRCKREGKKNDNKQQTVQWEEEWQEIGEVSKVENEGDEGKKEWMWGREKE